MVKMYKRVNRQTKEVIVGRFKKLANLDPRMWTYAQPITPRTLANPQTTRVRANGYLAERLENVINHSYIHYKRHTIILPLPEWVFYRVSEAQTLEEEHLFVRNVTRALEAI